MRTGWKIGIAIGLVAVPAAAFPAETISYTYDVLGRLIRVVHTGSVNNNVTANYSFDSDDSRTQVNVSGAP